MNFLLVVQVMIININDLECMQRGEVPMIEEERNMRREASVLRYKEKRQSRLFSKKIRYQVRKLNADKRPRFKVYISYFLLHL